MDYVFKYPLVSPVGDNQTTPTKESQYFVQAKRHALLRGQEVPWSRF